MSICSLKTDFTNIPPGTKLTVGSILFKILDLPEEAGESEAPAKQVTGEKLQIQTAARPAVAAARGAAIAAAGCGGGGGEEDSFSRIEIRVGRITKVCAADIGAVRFGATIRFRVACLVFLFLLFCFVLFCFWGGVGGFALGNGFPKLGREACSTRDSRLVIPYILFFFFFSNVAMTPALERAVHRCATSATSGHRLDCFVFCHGLTRLRTGVRIITSSNVFLSASA